MAGASYTDPIILSGNDTEQVSAVGDTLVTLRWYKIPATPLKSISISFTVAGGAPYQVGAWVYGQSGTILQVAAGGAGTYTFGPKNEDIYLAVMGPSGSTFGLFGASPGSSPMPEDVVLTVSSVALVLGEDRIYPYPITAFPFSYSVPSGYPGSSLFFSVPAAVDEPGAFLIVSTLGSSVTADTGLSANYPTTADPYWSVTRSIPASRGGLQRMTVARASPLREGLVVGVHTSSMMPTGLGMTLVLRTPEPVEGVVIDSYGAPAERSIALLYRDAANPYDMYTATTAVSDPVTGEFSLVGDVWNGEYVVMALDDAAENDVVARITVSDSIDNPYADP